MESYLDSDWVYTPEAVGSTDDIGSHLLDLAQCLLGDISRVVGSVRRDTPQLVEIGDITPPVHDHGGETPVDDGGSFLAEFASGAIGAMSYSFLARGSHNRLSFEIDGSRGAIRFNWNNRDEIRVALAPGMEGTEFRTFQMQPEHPDTWWIQGGMGSGYLEAHTIQLRKFVIAITTGRSASPSFREAARVQAIARALHESTVTGTWTATRR
jgi:predicted dehydrogenase